MKDPDWFQPDIEQPDLVFNPEPDDPPRSRHEEDEDDEEHKARNMKLIIKEIEEAKEALADPRDEIAEIELDRQKIMLSAAVGRLKISKKHTYKEMGLV